MKKNSRITRPVFFIENIFSIIFEIWHFICPFMISKFIVSCVRISLHYKVISDKKMCHFYMAHLLLLFLPLLPNNSLNTFFCKKIFGYSVQKKPFWYLYLLPKFSDFLACVEYINILHQYSLVIFLRHPAVKHLLLCDSPMCTS